MRRRDLLATFGSGADLALRQGVQFLVLLVLARILSPGEFGTVALLALFVSFAVVVADLGLTTALLQARELSQADISTAFWASAAVGGVLTLLAVVLAFPISTAVGAPQLGLLSAVMGTTVLATALGAVPSALLVKRFGFGRLLAVGVVGAAVSGAVAIVLALSGKGVWALAIQSVTMATVTTAGTWIAAGARPSWCWDWDAARRLLGTGRFVLAANVCDIAYSRAQTLLVGAAFGPSALGYYMRADSTQQLPADAAAAVVGRVALPVFAESAEDAQALRAGLRTSLRASMSVNAPAMALLGGLAGPAIHTLFGPRWNASAPLLTVLCLSGLLWPLHVMNINLLYAMGRARQVFVIDIVKKTAGFGATAVGALLFGVMGVAWAQVALGVFAVVINATAVRGAIGLTVREQIRPVAAVVGLALTVGAGAALASRSWHAQPAVELLTLGVGGAVAYLLLARLFRATAVFDTVALFRLKEGRS